MSVVHKKRSAVFNESKKTPYRLKIEEIICQHKDKLRINNRSTSKSKPSLVEKLSLVQAKKLEELHEKTARSRGSSLNSLLSGYDRNCLENVEQQF